MIKGSLSLLLGSLFCFVIATVMALTLRLPPIPNHIVTEPFIEYDVEPTFAHDTLLISEIPFLHVQLHPGDRSYMFVALKDNLRLRNREYDELFLASKRVTELEKWGQEMHIKNNLSRHKNLSDWKNYNEPKAWKLIFNDYNSWESEFARYMNLIDAEIEKINREKNPRDRSKKLGALRNYLEIHTARIDRAIAQMSREDYEENYLKELNKKVFNSYFAYINTFIPLYKPLEIEYMLNDLVNEHEQGLYQIRIDNIHASENLRNNIELKYDSHTYRPTHNAVGNDLTVFEQIPITEEKRMVLTIPQENLLANTQWREHPDHTRYYTYYIETTISNPNNKYYFKFESGLTKKIKMVLEVSTFRFAESAQSKTKDQVVKGNNLLEKEIIPVQLPEIIEQHFLFLNQKNNLNLRLRIESENKLTANELNKMNIELIRTYEPTLKLERTSYTQHTNPTVMYKPYGLGDYQIVTQHIGKNKQYQFISTLPVGWWVVHTDSNHIKVRYMPIYVFIMLGIVLGVLYGLRIVALKKMKHIALKQLVNSVFNFWKFDKKLSVSLFKQTAEIFYHFRVIIFVCSLLGILFHILILKREQNELIPLLFFTFLLSTIFYHISYYMVFNTALIFFAISSFFYIINLEVLSEKTAIWSFLFFSVGLIQTFIYERYKKNTFITWKDLLERIQDDIIKLVKKTPQPVQDIIFPLYTTIKHHVLKIYGPYPTTKKGYLILSLKIALTIFLLSVVIMIYVTINNFFIRLSLNPHIKKIEPTIVYHATKVVIRGGNFGWKENEKVILKHSGGEIYTDFWTDQKIIFSIPLHWQPGLVTIWIEKPILWEGKRIFAESKKIELKVLPRGTVLTADDEAYLKQLEHLDNETLHINGYSTR